MTILPPPTPVSENGAGPAQELVPVEPQRHDDLVVRLADPDAAVRLAAVEAVRQRDSETAVQLLAPLAAVWTADDEARGRKEAVAALESLRHPGASVHVANALLERPDDLGDADRDVLVRLAEAPENREGLTTTVAELVSALGERHARRAATMLVWLAPDSTEPLIEALGDPAKAAHAALALGQIHDRRAVDKLCSALQDGDAELRHAAAQALGEIRDPAALEALLRATADENFAVRVQAGAAFDRFGHSGVALATAALLAPALGKQAQDVRAQVDATIASLVSGPQASAAADGDQRPRADVTRLNDDELAELYDIATRASDSADRAGDEDYAEAWRERADAARLEARRRLRAGTGLDRKPKLRERVGGGGRPARLRAELRAAASD